MKFTLERTINAPRKDVYRALTDLTRWPERIESIVRIEPAGQGDGPLAFEEGVSFKETRVMFGKEHTETMTIRDIRPDTGYALTACSCGADHRYTHTLSDRPDGNTAVRIEADCRGQSLFAKAMGAIMGPVMKGSMVKCMQRDLDSIGRSLEQERAG